MSGLLGWGFLFSFFISRVCNDEFIGFGVQSIPFLSLFRLTELGGFPLLGKDMKKEEGNFDLLFYSGLISPRMKKWARMERVIKLLRFRIFSLLHVNGVLIFLKQLGVFSLSLSFLFFEN